MKVIKLDDIEYIRKDEVSTPIGDKRIIVADRGWVFIGDCVDENNGDVTIHNAKNIRYWGTTKGLGELVNGPTESTKVDEYGTVRTKAIITIAVTSGW